MQDNPQDNPKDNPQEYSKPSKKPRKDFTRESRDRKRLVELSTNILEVTTTLTITLSIVAGAI